MSILSEKGGAFTVGEKEKEGVRKKPAPDAVYHVLETLGVEKDAAVYIGDSEVDIKTAENADMDAVLVSWGFRDAQFLRDLGVARLAASMKELKRELFN